jgi:hypothetical protein
MMEEAPPKDMPLDDGYDWDTGGRAFLFSTNLYLLTRPAVHPETNRAIERRREDCRDCESNREAPADSS